MSVMRVKSETSPNVSTEDMVPSVNTMIPVGVVTIIEFSPEPVTSAIAKEGENAIRL
ncbi:MAG: hypothetical protein UX96_C0040G0006 [Candidatus Wolfebacteria bacterium GW2011_GWB1_47_243]|nr:MAG: hypothetical protein UX96_C0040G0006 [Candidatus Wolfebacteria bacterium GW2011_GWB1_47_243]